MRRLTILASLIALFFLGGVCGFALAVRAVKNTLNESYWVGERMKEESKRLKLTPEQRAKAQPSYDALQQDLGNIKTQTMESIVAATLKQSVALAALLTPAQADEFKKLNEERRVRLEQKARK